MALSKGNQEKKDLDLIQSKINTTETIVMTKRLNEHKGNEKLEELLNEVNSLFAPMEAQAIAPFEKNKYPVILIMGAARSGTTLLLQWLASLGYFSYPTNMLSRFYGAPYIGSKIQLMLTTHDFNNEIFDFNEVVPFTSRLGKTMGALAPNEFWYFWRRFFHFGEIQQLTEDELKSVDRMKFVAEIAAIEAVFEKPFAMKGMIVNWNIPFISSILDKVLFVHVKRHPFYNIQSLMKARMDYYGDLRGWYSFKPPEYSDLKNKSPYEQIAGQIFFTNRAIEEGLKAVAPERILKVSYEQFCQSPECVFEKIRNKFSLQGYPSDWVYKGPEMFTDTNKVTLSDDERGKVIEAFNNITGETIVL